jgi:S1-C subfamily serine protease
MITSNVLSRTFQIQFGGQTGTAVAIDRGQKQYLVTAKHVVSTFSGGPLDIFHDGQWKKAQFGLVGHAKSGADISVLAPSIQLAPSLTLVASTANMVLGQSMFFLGFPYDHKQDHPEINKGFPLPLIKAGILSGLMDYEGSSALLLDGHNNPGFSGGPVVFIPYGSILNQTNGFCLAGIVSGYPSYSEQVVTSDGKETGMFIRNNPGIVLSYDIKYALELIDANPIGWVIN